MRLLAYIFMVAMALNISCSHTKLNDPLFDQIESVITTHPDRAATLLSNLTDVENQGDEYFARWCMLSGKITDETLEGLLPVHQWQRAQEWYKKNGTVEQQAQIALYLGRAHVEDGEYDNAMKIYTDALIFALKHREYNIAGYICTYMADLYSFRDMSDQSLLKQKEAGELFKKAKNWKSYAYSLKNLAIEWAYIDSFANAHILLKEADSIAIQFSNKYLNSAITNASGIIYSMEKKYDKAEDFFLKAIQHNTQEVRKDSIALAEAYIGNNQLDKAKEILKHISIIEPDYSINKLYYLLHKAEGNYKEALYYKEICSNMLDSITLLQNKTRVLEIDKKYNATKIREENSKLQIAQQRSIILLIISASVSIFIILGYFLHKQKTKNRIYKQAIELNNIKTELVRLKEERTSLENNLVDKDNRVQQLQEGIESLTIKFHQLQQKKLETSTIGKKLLTLVKKIPGKTISLALTPKLWSDITTEVANTYPQFYHRLLNQCPSLNEQDWQYCCLHIFGFDGNDEAKLLDINPDSVRMKRSRLKRKLNIKEKEESSLRNLLIDYLLS